MSYVQRISETWYILVVYKRTHVVLLCRVLAEAREAEAQYIDSRDHNCLIISYNPTHSYNTKHINHQLGNSLSISILDLFSLQ